MSNSVFGYLIPYTLSIVVLLRGGFHVAQAVLEFTMQITMTLNS